MATVQCHEKLFTGVQAVIFDKDGTLADTAQYLKLLARQRSRLLDAQVPGVESPLLSAFGVDGDRLDPAGLMAVGSRYDNEIAAAAYVAETGRSWPTALTLVKQVFQQAEQSPWDKAAATPLFSGCQALIKAMTRLGLKVAIASSDTPANVQAFIEYYDLIEDIRVFQGTATDASLSKPDPRFFLTLCQALEVAPKAALMIGDGQFDMTMAHEAGALGAIGIVAEGNTRESSPSLIGADCLLARVTQLQVISVSDL